MVGAACLLGLLAWQGHHLAHALPRLEQAIAALGPWGPVAFVAAVLLLEPLLVPDSLLGIAAGVAFGLVAGFAYYFGAVYAASLLVYLAGRRWLRQPALRLLRARPQLAHMVGAARRRVMLNVWLRLLPLNPAIVSYALGAADVSFRSVAIGALAMSPHMFLTVYLGVAAAHVTRMAGTAHAHWEIEGIGLLLGLAACAGLMLQVSRLAWAELEAAEPERAESSG